MRSLLLLFLINIYLISFTFYIGDIEQMLKGFYIKHKPKRLYCENQFNKVMERKYIGANFQETGGLGNQIWRFASLYGIGRDIGRHPYFEANNTEQMNSLKEFSEVFPVIHEMLHVKNPSDSFVKKLIFAEDCCKYDDPKKLIGLSEKYIKVVGNYLQSYKFFHSYQNEIRTIFQCGSFIQTSTNNYAKNLFKSDKSLKLCAHIRRGDFIKDILLESKEDFVIPAIKYAFKYLKEKNENVSLVFIGNDEDFINSVNVNLVNVGFSNIYKPKLKFRGEDICFAINHCDSMILTASGSTFGWWISYLMNPNSTIFYNSQVSDTSEFSKDVHDFDIFLPEWIMLTLTGNEVKREKQWWHQRRNQLPDLPSNSKILPWI